MSPPLILVSYDKGLIRHWQNALAAFPAEVLTSFAALRLKTLPAGSMVWLDDSLPDLPDWQATSWQPLLMQTRLVIASSNPDRAAAMAALAKGAQAYCHAYADIQTLQQIHDVVAAGNVWVGRELMQELLQSVQRAAEIIQPVVPDWARGLTEREQEVARMVAHGASNRDIASACNITERTVKAHLAAAFTKLGISDRLQLALRVHGIQ